MRLPSFRIERWYERYEFTTELQLSSSDCESVSTGELLSFEPGAREQEPEVRMRAMAPILTGPSEVGHT